MELTSVETTFDAWDKFGMLIPKKLSGLLSKYSEAAFDEAMGFIQENKRTFNAERFFFLVSEVGKMTKGKHMLDAKWELSLAINHLRWCAAVEGQSTVNNHIGNCLVYLLTDLAEENNEGGFLTDLKKLK